MTATRPLAGPQPLVEVAVAADGLPSQQARPAPASTWSSRSPTRKEPGTAVLGGVEFSLQSVGAVPIVPGCARARTQEILWTGLACLADTSEIVVSELVTDSLNASRGVREAFLGEGPVRPRRLGHGLSILGITAG